MNIEKEWLKYEKKHAGHLRDRDCFFAGYNLKSDGLTRREYFAGLAMQGFLSNHYYTEYLKGNTLYPVPSELAILSVECADELIKQLDK